MPGIVVEPIVAIARRATIIGLEHGIAAVDEELRQPIETPLVTRGGAAVWHDDRLKVLAVAARRKREIGGDRRTVRRRIADRRHLAERSEEHTSELQSLMRISYAVFCLKKKNNKTNTNIINKII